ncbi:hypothetical protein [Roseofilum capinflatum]|uniref:Uncharacterized protein n=1 Tax=Roseofilum capinflatum BLCC-M114 TaxID=3022440 RepID=A0ABT7BAU7_9CYAN|nr:hypothetical protein [Roseofilum capinflatum]MDJ1176282.1 hypothetical protein [Roseofilum capinflatum BLCC-M114]
MRYINDCFERSLKWLKVLPSLLFVPPIPPFPHSPITARSAVFAAVEFCRYAERERP